VSRKHTHLGRDHPTNPYRLNLSLGMNQITQPRVICNFVGLREFTSIHDFYASISPSVVDSTACFVASHGNYFRFLKWTDTSINWGPRSIEVGGRAAHHNSSKFLYFRS
jgi:hypothetical protein